MMTVRRRLQPFGSLLAARSRRFFAGQLPRLLVDHLPRFLARRLSRDSALGLSLTLSFIAIVLGGWAFGEIAEGVVEREDLSRYDTPVTGWFADRRTEPLTEAMRLLTHLGGSWFTIPLVVLAGVLLPMRFGRWRTVVVLVAVTGGTALLVQSIKLLIARPRPVLSEVIAAAHGYAFPSGHMAQAVATYGVLAFLVSARIGRMRWRAAVWSCATVLAALVGLTRVYLGVHWLTDVLGGFVIAAVWLVAVLSTVFTVSDVRARRSPPRPVPEPSEHRT